MSFGSSLWNLVGNIARDMLESQQASQRRSRQRARDTGRSARRTTSRSSTTATGYPGDYRGLPELSYAPRSDRFADPGEVVWGWVPYEEDHSQGKDRPVLVIGRDGGWLLCLQLTSQDHDRDARQEAADGRYWVDVGVGSWDRQGRASEVRVDRIVRMDPEQVRRQGGRLTKARFDDVARGVRRHCNR